jgi:pyruvate dehydrogenase E1 component
MTPQTLSIGIPKLQAVDEKGRLFFRRIFMVKTAVSGPPPDTLHALEVLDTQLRWLSSWTVHNANHVREKRDGMKVGGHQASCASMTSIMAALYFHAPRPQDKLR